MDAKVLYLSLKFHPEQCPNCHKETVTTEDTEAQNGRYSMRRVCSDCNFAWYEDYKLVDTSEIDNSPEVPED